MSTREELARLRTLGYSISTSYYPIDGLWYCIAKASDNDPGIRCRAVSRSESERGVIERLGKLGDVKVKRLYGVA